jgi:hypothetical protein
MEEENIEEEKNVEGKVAEKKGGEEIKTPAPTSSKKKLFGKISPKKMFSPAGIVIFILSIIVEFIKFIIDIFLPGSSSIVGLIPDIFIAVLSCVLLDTPIIETLIPFIIERIPIISDILPSWVIYFLLKML